MFKMLYLNHVKVTLLTSCVILSFVFTSLGWRHIEWSQQARILVAATILISIYVMIIFELVNRTLATLIGAAISVAAYDCLVERVGMQEILRWQDLETLSLLFGMMIIVNVLALSGLFDFLAVWAYKRAAGRFWLLIITLSFVVAFLSAILDNVSTMLLVAPTLVKLAELENLDPRYVLMIMVIACNIGGCATPVGDPPNLIIIGDPFIGSLNITFGSFVAYAAPCVLLTLMTVLGYLKLAYRTKDSFELLNEYDLDDVSKASSVRIMELGGRVSNGRVDSARSSRSVIDRMMPDQTIRSKPILFKSLSVLITAVVLFFVQSLPGTNLSLGWISLFAGLTVLALSSDTKLQAATQESDDEDMRQKEDEDLFELVINSIEWSTLMFFFSLFIVMEVMNKLGLIAFMGAQICELVSALPSGLCRDIGAITIVLWSSALASALIDNVPFTSMMVKVLGSMAMAAIDADNVNSAEVPFLNMKALVFALSLGACYGGNGTLIGASANLVTAGVANRYGYPISFNGYLRFCAAPTLISVLIANIYLVLVFVVFNL